MSSVLLPHGLLSLADWDALPEDETYKKAELVEGVLLLNPPPVSDHQIVAAELYGQLNASIRRCGWIAVPDVEVVLDAGDPPLVRNPDLSVVALAVARTHPKRYLAQHVRLAVEISSPGSRRNDRVAKMSEYAEAGIPDYWIVELGDEVHLDTFELTGDVYQPRHRAAAGVVTATLGLDGADVPVTLDLDSLLP